MRQFMPRLFLKEYGFIKRTGEDEFQGQRNPKERRKKSNYIGKQNSMSKFAARIKSDRCFSIEENFISSWNCFFRSFIYKKGVDENTDFRDFYQEEKVTNGSQDETQFSIFNFQLSIIHYPLSIINSPLI